MASAKVYQQGICMSSLSCSHDMSMYLYIRPMQNDAKCTQNFGKRYVDGEWVLSVA